MLDQPLSDHYPSSSTPLNPTRTSMPPQPFSCPTCGLPMRCIQTIQPTGRYPPN
jgi:hypothetical protein